MDFADFSTRVVEHYTRALRGFSEDIQRGLMHPLASGTLLYPNLALFVETANHLICERFGAEPTFRKLQIKKHRQDSYSSYFGQFDTEPQGASVVRITHPKSFITLSGSLLSRDLDRTDASNRFHLDFSQFPKFVTPSGAGSVVIAGPDSGTCLFDNCVLINRSGDLLRVKYIAHLIVVSKRGELQLPGLDPPAGKPGQTLTFGCHVSPIDAEADATLAQQFTSLFLVPGLRETTIGAFLRMNPIFLKRAFSCQDVLYEQELPWLEGNPDPMETSIRPDLLLKRADGFFDICDLKTPLLEKLSLARGGHRRRRFINDVHEGLAQLANYRSYFEFSKNREFARSKHGIEVQNPRLFLVVGNFENAPPEEIDEASRLLGKDSAFEVIDYDTLNAMYRFGR